MNPVRPPWLPRWLDWTFVAFFGGLCIGTGWMLGAGPETTLVIGFVASIGILDMAWKRFIRRVLSKRGIHCPCGCC